MSLPSIVIAAIIFSIMSMAAFTQAGFILDLKEKNEQTATMQYVKKAILSSYTQTGAVFGNSSGDLSGLSIYSEMDVGKLVDLTGVPFAVLNNGGSAFSFEGSGSIYSAVVVAQFKDGLNSEISSNEFLSRGSENYLLITTIELAATPRGKTLSKITACSTASQNYQSIEGAYAVNSIQLVAGNYLEGSEILDGFGNNFVIGGTGECYSKGLNGIDNNKSSDDIF
ncbi:hypothetical protein [Thiomicrorhabdus aquaedulcis]|uniref:hypothetical protein n=1 Tax=Thiomicrorhabdus aquaedulcis TaxID=2211106 RepID=UPI000FD86302|nr:hypothetical protein [Thiomicrorhabdus aquaedulcis]